MSHYKFVFSVSWVVLSGESLLFLAAGKNVVVVKGEGGEVGREMLFKVFVVVYCGLYVICFVFSWTIYTLQDALKVQSSLLPPRKW